MFACVHTPPFLLPDKMPLPFVNKDVKPKMEKALVTVPEKFDKIKAITIWICLVLLLVLLLLVFFRFCYPLTRFGGSIDTFNGSNIATACNSDDIPSNSKNNDTSADYSSELARHVFKISPKDFCTNNSSEVGVMILVLVTSALENFDFRQAIRETWGSVTNREESPIRLVFITGTTTNTTISLNVQKESDENNDIVQADLLDSQRNSTLKSILTLKWASENCPQAQFFLKINDDVFVNFRNLANALTSEILSFPEHYILGFVQENLYPERNEDKEEYVPEEDYPDDVFPPHISGSSYFIPGHTLSELYKTILQIPPLPIGDAFITGICAKKMGATLIHDDLFYSKSKPPEEEAFKDLATTSGLSPDKIYDIFQQHIGDVPNFLTESVRNLLRMKQLLG